MKKIYLAVMAIACSFVLTQTAFAVCGPGTMPQKISEGQWFIDKTTVELMGGDLTKPINWSGDMNSWGGTPAEVVSSPAPGVVVKGTGPDHFRWNLRQVSLGGNNGWLYIENAFHSFGDCPNIYTPGTIAPNGYDWKGRGPSFWSVQ